jgi:hypothetical protein
MATVDIPVPTDRRPIPRRWLFLFFLGFVAVGVHAMRVECDDVIPTTEDGRLLLSDDGKLLLADGEKQCSLVVGDLRISLPTWAPTLLTALVGRLLGG